MKKSIHLVAIATTIILFSACSKKDKTGDETAVPVEQSTTTQEDGGSVTIEAGDKGGKVVVDSKEGTDVNINIDKKGGEVKVEEKGTSVDVHVKDDGKQN